LLDPTIWNRKIFPIQLRLKVGKCPAIGQSQLTPAGRPTIAFNGIYFGNDLELKNGKKEQEIEKAPHGVPKTARFSHSKK